MSFREKRLRQYIEEMERKGKLMLDEKDPKRIVRILTIIEKIWEKYPQLRLGQLIGNCFDASEDLFEVKDSELEIGLKETYENIDSNR